MSEYLMADELRQHILHACKELTRRNRLPWHERQRLEQKIKGLLTAAPIAQTPACRDRVEDADTDPGPDYPDGHDHEGCERMGCGPVCVTPAVSGDEGAAWSGALLQVAVVLEALRSSDSATRLANLDAGRVLGEAYAKLKRIRATRPAQTEQPALTVWEGAMPESNGKSNFTAILMRKGGKLFDSMSGGMTIARSEYPDRVRYEADCVRWLIGELENKPCILDYDADKHSGYVKPASESPPTQNGQLIGYTTMGMLEIAKASPLTGRIGVRCQADDRWNVPVYAATVTPPPVHPDDAAVDRFAAAMKAKLAASREKGRGGWDDPAQCSDEYLAKLLVEHLSKGNAGTLEDVANFAMMLHQRDADPLVLAAAAAETPMAVIPDWLRSFSAMGDRLMAAGWRPDADAQGDGLRKMQAEYVAPVCPPCNGAEVVATTDKDHNGDTIERRCPSCQTPVDGQTFMGEPLVQPYEAPRKQVNELFKLLGFKGQAEVGVILDAAISAIKAAQHADGLVEALEATAHALVFMPSCQRGLVEQCKCRDCALALSGTALAAHRAGGAK